MDNIVTETQRRNPEVTDKLANFLRKIRESAGISKYKLGMLMYPSQVWNRGGMSRNIYKYEYGEKSPGMHVITALAKHCGYRIRIQAIDDDDNVVKEVTF